MLRQFNLQRQMPSQQAKIEAKRSRRWRFKKTYWKFTASYWWVPRHFRKNKSVSHPGRLEYQVQTSQPALEYPAGSSGFHQIQSPMSSAMFMNHNQQHLNQNWNQQGQMQAAMSNRKLIAKVHNINSAIQELHPPLQDPTNILFKPNQNQKANQNRRRNLQIIKIRGL